MKACVYSNIQRERPPPGGKEEIPSFRFFLLILDRFHQHMLYMSIMHSVITIRSRVCVGGGGVFPPGILLSRCV